LEVGESMIVGTTLGEYHRVPQVRRTWATLPPPPRPGRGTAAPVFHGFRPPEADSTRGHNPWPRRGRTEARLARSWRKPDIQLSEAEWALQIEKAVIRLIELSQSRMIPSRDVCSLAPIRSPLHRLLRTSIPSRLRASFELRSSRGAGVFGPSPALRVR